MLVGIFPDADALADEAARRVIRTLDAETSPTLGVATGSTPRPLYARLRAAHAAGQFSLEDVPTYALDEYVGLSPAQPQSYRHELLDQLTGPAGTGLREENLHTPHALADDPWREAQRYDALVGGAHVTIQILGIGENGHVGFNEPGGSLASRSHVSALTESTRHANARFFDDDVSAVPELSITQGLSTIALAECLILLATGTAKARAIRELVEGPVSAHWPATALQWHQDLVVLVDEDAASELEFAHDLREQWAAARHRH